ncbi:MAG TPA: transposase [Caulifigura sp.]|jgi:hypothetical protein|nr:transposase [Caulifigura sp.]
MSHQDCSSGSSALNSQQLARALQWLLAGVDFKSVTLRRDCSWTPRLLVSAAILWAWSNEQTLGERFFAARRIITHLFPQQTSPAGSSQAFMKLLRKWTATLVGLLQIALRQRMQKNFSAQWTTCGFAVFGVDGSRVELPRTKSHQDAYAPAAWRSGAKRRTRRRKQTAAQSRKASVPQMWLTTMFHVGTGLPWDWRTGPSDSSERAHALEMLSSLPERSLITADAGFVGYDFARTVRDSGRHLLVRVGGNVRLLRHLGFVRESHGLVYVWTDQAARRQDPPLVFRLIRAQGPKHPICLLISVLPRKTLRDRDVFDLYRRRWGIELFYRHLKQTFQRRKLRSTSVGNAAVELEWSLVGLWGLGLSAAAEIARTGIPLARISMAGVLRTIRRLLRDYLHPVPSGQTLCRLLRSALIDPYRRTNKQSRDYPRKKPHDIIGLPTITEATPRQIRQARLIKARMQKG